MIGEGKRKSARESDAVGEREREVNARYKATERLRDVLINLQSPRPYEGGGLKGGQNVGRVESVSRRSLAQHQKGRQAGEPRLRQLQFHPELAQGVTCTRQVVGHTRGQAIASHFPRSSCIVWGGMGGNEIVGFDTAR